MHLGHSQNWDKCNHIQLLPTKKLQLDVSLTDDKWLIHWPIDPSIGHLVQFLPSLSRNERGVIGVYRCVTERGPELGHKVDSHSLQAACVFKRNKGSGNRHGWLQGGCSSQNYQWMKINKSDLLQLVTFIAMTPSHREHLSSTPVSGVYQHFSIAGKGAACLHSRGTVPINPPPPHQSLPQSKELLSLVAIPNCISVSQMTKKQLNTKYWSDLFRQLLTWHSSPTDQISSWQVGSGQFSFFYTKILFNFLCGFQKQIQLLSFTKH